MSKYGVISGPYFPVFSPNTGKGGPEITLYLDTFNAVLGIVIILSLTKIAEVLLYKNYAVNAKTQHSNIR